MSSDDREIQEVLAEVNLPEDDEGKADKKATDDDDKDDSDESMEEHGSMYTLKWEVIKLIWCNDLGCSDCCETLGHVRNMLAKAFKESGDRWEKSVRDLHSIGSIEIFQKVMKTDYSDYKPWLLNLRRFTDKCPEACTQVLEIDLYRTIVERLRTDMKKISLDTVCAGLKILYNVIQVEERARELFRACGIVQVLQQVHRVEAGLNNNEFQLLCIILTSWVINENENDIVDGKVFSRLESQLGSSLMRSDHRSPEGYQSVEILAAINKLAVNDANKKRIAESGILRHYASFLLPTGDSKEQLLAAEGLWTLALMYPKEVKKEKSCIEGLKSLVENKKIKRDVKIQAIGALNELYKINPVPQSDAKHQGTGKPGHIFISYQWGSKVLVHEIKDQLRAAGFPIWIDTEQIKGQLVEDICRGIDSSSLVIACISQGYYESAYCKKELHYATTNRKEVIPLTVEPGYTPRSWLNFLLGGFLRLDFSTPERYEASWPTLVNRINEILGRDNGSTTKTDHNARDVKPKGPDVKSWTKPKVREWLQKRKLRKLQDFFKGFNGERLLEFKSTFLEDTPESATKKFLKLYSFKCLTKLKMALKDLKVHDNEIKQSSGFDKVKDPGVSSWKKGHVQTWLQTQKLRSLQEFFKDYNGEKLLEFRLSLLKESPESSTHQFLKDFSFKCLVKLKIAFKNL